MTDIKSIDTDLKHLTENSKIVKCKAKLKFQFADYLFRNQLSSLVNSDFKNLGEVENEIEKVIEKIPLREF